MAFFSVKLTKKWMLLAACVALLVAFPVAVTESYSDDETLPDYDIDIYTEPSQTAVGVEDELGQTVDFVMPLTEWQPTSDGTLFLGASRSLVDDNRVGGLLNEFFEKKAKAFKREMLLWRRSNRNKQGAASKLKKLFTEQKQPTFQITVKVTYLNLFCTENYTPAPWMRAQFSYEVPTVGETYGLFEHMKQTFFYKDVDTGEIKDEVVVRLAPRPPSLSENVRGSFMGNAFKNTVAAAFASMTRTEPSSFNQVSSIVLNYVTPTHVDFRVSDFWRNDGKCNVFDGRFYVTKQDGLEGESLCSWIDATTHQSTWNLFDESFKIRFNVNQADFFTEPAPTLCGAVTKNGSAVPYIIEHMTNAISANRRTGSKPVQDIGFYGDVCLSMDNSGKENLERLSDSQGIRKVTKFFHIGIKVFDNLLRLLAIKKRNNQKHKKP